MQDIVHDAQSFATQITAKGACRYTNTTRNPLHCASQGGKAGDCAAFFRILGIPSVGEQSHFCSKFSVTSVQMRLMRVDRVSRIAKPQVVSIRDVALVKKATP